ncbi:MAG TPA: hypothetical protein VGD17_19415 [Chitinophagaceae bacterium]
MYTQVWMKYLPVIKILLKRSLTSDQLLDLNRPDFERAGIARKSAHKFHIEFSNGRVNNVISASALAKNLAGVLLEDKVVKETFTLNDYTISMNTKFQLSIKYIAKQPVEEEVKQPEELVSTEVPE